jgi:shikimate kinase
MKNIILFGLKNSGKTTLGKKLSAILNYNFIDTDLLLEKIYLKEHKCPLTYKEIYKNMGEPFFRELEKRAILSLNPYSQSIISLGGGTAAQISLHPLLQDLGHLFYLKVSYDTFLKNNYSERACPTSILFRKTESDLKTLFDKKTTIFEKLPAKILNVDNPHESDIIKEMINAIK